MTVGDRLTAALAAKAGAPCRGECKSMAWRSATFAGERHCLTLHLDDQEALLRLLANIADHEFTIPRILVADVAVSTPRVGAAGATVDFEILTIDAD